MKKRDFILIGIILAIGLILLAVFFLTQEKGAYVEVRKDNEIIAKYSLSQDGEYSLNGGTNILKIEDGKAYMKEANCPKQTCVKDGKISRTNESIVCAENKIAVYVRGADDSVDLVS